MQRSKLNKEPITAANAVILILAGLTESVELNGGWFTSIGAKDPLIYKTTIN